MTRLPLFIIALGFFISGCSHKSDKPNVLFICIDDLNDWTGYLGGHPDAKTPNLDELASSSVVFSKAYCPAPACNPSRASIMTGVLPSTSGVYINPQPWRASPVLKDIQTIPQYFREQGYVVKGSGKTFHDRYADPDSWDQYWPSLRKQRPDDPMPENRPINGIPNTAHFDWGPVDVPKEAMGDWRVADWIIEQLNTDHEKPFFMACGFFRPHLPWYVPQEYFDKFPSNKISLPLVKAEDVEDIPDAGKAMIRFNDHENVLKHGQWKKAVQGYLSSINFVDECLGRVIDALGKSKYKDNTIIVLWSDHGWNLGEKQHWRKFALWENTTRTNFLLKAPGISANGSTCNYSVSLVNIYPTLVELCGLPVNPRNEGKSLVPLLRNPTVAWHLPALTTHGINNHTIRLNEWRFLHYADSSMELYNHLKDPNEWDNVTGDPANEAIQRTLKDYLPSLNVDPIPMDR